jgi:type IV secretory pathway TrbD component
MVEAALVVLALASSYLGFALFALSQKPHRSSVAGLACRAPLPRAARQRCRALGTAALALGLGASLWAEGPSFGSLLWVLGLAGGRPERDVHAQPSPALAARRRAHDRPRLG